MEPGNPSRWLPSLARLYRYWSGKRPPGGGLPRRADIDPLEMRAFMGHLLLLDLAEPLEDSRYRLFGTMLAGYFGTDLTGMRLKEIPAAHPDTILEEYRQALELGDATLTRNRAKLGSSVRLYEKLMLPLAGPDGRIAGFLAAIYVVEED
ncbi:MAG TPA: PAS domain-containing protein [Alphaproteobacteria bacterium]|jgi:hypothetical protein|nr:PAS domain-containing protein [Alphaproteobacteria bacterium]